MAAGARPLTAQARRLAALAWVLALAACAGSTAGVAPPPASDSTVSIWVVDHGWHTAIVVRRADVDQALWPEVEDVAGAVFVEIAWGDREFYMAAEASAWLALKAAFGTGRSVLHVVGLDGPIAAHFPRSEIVELPLSRSGLEALLRFVSAEHARDPGRRAVRLQRGLYGESWFYAARSQYSLRNTCNTWVARALETAGLPVTPSGVVTAGGVMERVRPLRIAR